MRTIIFPLPIADTDLDPRFPIAFVIRRVRCAGVSLIMLVFCSFVEGGVLADPLNLPHRQELLMKYESTLGLNLCVLAHLKVSYIEQNRFDGGSRCGWRSGVVDLAQMPVRIHAYGSRLFYGVSRHFSMATVICTC